STRASTRPPWPRSWAATSAGCWPTCCPDATCPRDVPRRSASIDGPKHRTGDLVSQTAPSHAADDVAPAVAELDTIVSLAKRRGFVFPSSEIYGGINAVWDYGPLGVELKNNVKRA